MRDEVGAMRAGVWVAMITAVGLAVAACGGGSNDSGYSSGSKQQTSSSATTATTATNDTSEGAAGSGTLTVHLSATAGSGVTGTAKLTSVDDATTKVVVTLDSDPTSDSHPAHIHAGTCAKFDAAPKYPLENVVKGTSTTEVKAPIASLQDAPYIINVHQSDAQITKYIACGTVSTGGKPMVVPLAQQSKSGVTGTVTLTPMGDKTKVDVKLAGDTSKDAHPAHIHDGTCAKFDAATKYPLTNVVNGSSTTTLDVPIADLLDEAYVVNVHQSDAQITQYIACGTVA
jgi:hypothetical protein